jgi:hypothetical protein
MKPQDFANEQPHLILEEFFAGQTRAWGIFEDRFGDVRAQFVVDISGTWDGRELTLVEDFLYNDGRTDRRIWVIKRIDPHTYEGRAGDVIGSATGTVFGNALNWRYDMDLKVGARTIRVHFNDWMFLQPNNVMINRARVSKWGVTVGEVTLFFSKPVQAVNSAVIEQPAAAVEEMAH